VPEWPFSVTHMSVGLRFKSRYLAEKVGKYAPEIERLVSRSSIEVSAPDRLLSIYQTTQWCG